MRISATAGLLAAALIACAPTGPAAADDTPAGLLPSAADPDRVCVTVPVQSLAQAVTNFFAPSSATGAASASSTAPAATASAAAGVAATGATNGMAPGTVPGTTSGTVPGTGVSQPPQDAQAQGAQAQGAQVQGAAGPAPRFLGFELPRDVRVLEAASC
ncbi:unnamed protein product [[Actinomadura] parvosata subsp. kistnae]|uniref:Uncharacterized protein n=1 Tax=[Actinomadura] parvosata subsp. kistnae TaxID=1909395 RepID=A0A1V0A0I6_9ACTN|nr:hypothetical protein [Nonomuraea sp. ATCC 55076]AQZ63716.1 hypothetical protein BKM31_21645 [Nonomuraea sp. ATCC 55076]SPL89516.1 unnamed protein product [Actinomadura parvosata subsp. kistnae]